MDRLIKRLDYEMDGDLRVTRKGVGYLPGSCAYGDGYMAKFQAYDPMIVERVLAGRWRLVANHYSGPLLDIGAGDGRFVLGRPETFGYEVIPQAVRELHRQGRYSAQFKRFTAFSMWDVIEHLENPERYLKRVPRNGYLFISLPVFPDLKELRGSKHYRPGEHLYYCTEEGLLWWLGEYGFRLLERSDHETAAGREAIGAYAFRRDLPDRNDHVALYQQMHDAAHYGASAELYLDAVRAVVERIKPHSILDYGCGRSDLAVRFWRDGERRVTRYDPAIAEFKLLPKDAQDLTLCIDVLEHIPMAWVDQVLAGVRRLSRAALFVISLKPSRATLPDGRNAHVTLMTREEWQRWLGDYFPRLEEIPTEWDHVLMALGHTL